jgi:hypothetical protein
LGRRFPNSKEQFLELLNSLGAASPESWVFESSSFNRKKVLQYLFLRSVWMFVENPAQSSYKPEKVARSRAWSEAHERRRLQPYVPIAEKMLSAGISPEEISALVYESQVNLIFQILYILDDNECAVPVDLGDMGFGLFETKDDQAVGNRWGINDLLQAARPAEFPDRAT